MRTAICPTPLHFHDLVGHFLALSPNDRVLRFGGAMSDAPDSPQGSRWPTIRCVPSGTQRRPMHGCPI
jgi:hypothetical protein